MLLYSETPNVHKHTLKIGIIHVADFHGEFTFDFFRAEFQRRLHLLEPLRLKLVDTPMKLHHPMWLVTSDIDLDYHLRRVRGAYQGAVENSTSSSAKSPARLLTVATRCGRCTS